jgi:hypothetical protein
MKKVFVIASVGVLMFATSCKKNYNCTFTDPATVVSYPKLTKSQASSTETVCKAAGGTWAKK